MISAVQELFEDRIVKVEIIGGIESVLPIFFWFDLKRLRDEISIASHSGKNGGIANAVINWENVNNKSVLYLCNIFIESPEILPETDVDWEYDVEDCAFIFENLNNKVFLGFISKVEILLKKFVSDQNEIYRILELFIKYETAKETPKRCECDKPKAPLTDEDAANCNCCQHLRLTEGWNPDFCSKGCLYSKFPLWVWGLWELAAMCMVRVSSGMSISLEIGIDNFNRFVRKTKVTDEDQQDEIYDYCKLLLYKWEELKEHPAPFLDNDVEKVWNLTEDVINKEE